MALTLLKTRLAIESETINATLLQELDNLPAPCQPVARHIMAAGGKRLRPFLTVIVAKMFAYPAQDIYRLACSLEMLHAATLLHDDVLDNADSRRNTPTAHLLHGINAAILGGDALLALGNAVVATFNNSALSLAYSKATMETAAGEVLEMASLHNPQLPYAEYLKIAAGKTGCLIAQACAMGAIAANATPRQIKDCENFGYNLGIAFQLVDDALDFAPESQTGKPRGGDLREGKLTPPVQLYREQLKESERRDFDEEFKNGQFANLEALLNAIGEFSQASLILADDLLAQAKAALSQLPENEEHTILAEMVEYVRLRKK